MRRFVVGDIHGAYLALTEVLHRADFNKDDDMLIGVGDYVDGWPQSYEVVDYLSHLPHFVGVMGNHDQWLLNYINYGLRPPIWVTQGGQATIESYTGVSGDDLRHHGSFLRHLDTALTVDNTLICHGGAVSCFDLLDIKRLTAHEIMWDRELFLEFAKAKEMGLNGRTNPYDRVIIGHTTTTPIIQDMSPFHYGGLWNIDQGAGWEGKLTLLDFDSEEYWQSDVVGSLYDGVRGRR